MWTGQQGGLNWPEPENLGAAGASALQYPRIFMYDLPEKFATCWKEDWELYNYGAELRVTQAGPVSHCADHQHSMACRPCCAGLLCASLTFS